MPNISVIVPVYKVEPYLRRCVGSLLAQTYEDFELILVDDGSPDRCGELCEALAMTDSRIHVLHQANGGLSAARNTGIDWAFANSDSKWLAFVDSDDWVDKTYLQQLARAVEETGCRLSVCGLYRTDGSTQELSPAYACTVMAGEDYYCSREVHGGMTAVAWNKLYHKSLFQNCRYPVGKLHEDEFTTYRLVYQAGQVAVVPGALYAYFQNDAGIMRSQWSPRRLHVLEAVEQQIAFARSENHPRLWKKAAMQYIFSAHDQLGQLSDAPDGRKYRRLLEKKLRFGLEQGRKSGAFPLNWENIWAYEEAYPGLKPVWWLLYQARKGGAMKGTISVIVPVYNVAAYLPQAVESILNQDYSQLEVILIDDGSRDGSGALCDGFAARDARVKVIHQENGGAAAAKNAGLRAATGEFLSFVDSDDYLEPNVYRYMVNILLTENADVVHCAFRNVYKTHQEDFVLHPGRSGLDPVSYLKRFHKDWTCALLWNKLYRRGLFDGVYFEEGHRIDDEFFTYQGMMNAKKIVMDEKIVYNYRRRASSAMNSPKAARQLQLDRVDYLDKRRKKVAERFPELKWDFDFGYMDALVYLSQNADNDPVTIQMLKKRLISYLTTPGSTRPPRYLLKPMAKLLLTSQKKLLAQCETRTKTELDDYFA